MKKIIFYVLCLVMLLGCVVACNKQTESPTDVLLEKGSVVSKTEETLNKEGEIISVKEQANTIGTATANTSNAEKETDLPTSKSDIVSKAPSPSKEPTKKQTGSKATNADNSVAQMQAPQETPLFNTESAFVNWLKAAGTEYQEEWADVMNNVSHGNQIRYFKPAFTASNECTLRYVRVISKNTVEYHYDHGLNPWPDANLLIAVSIGDDTFKKEQFLQGKQEYLQGKPARYSVTVDNIAYVYYYNEDFESAVVYWEQFGKYHSANILRTPNQLDQILPLLKLEQVTVDLANDHVTQ